jgi:hypothetical protein
MEEEGAEIYEINIFPAPLISTKPDQGLKRFSASRRSPAKRDSRICKDLFLKSSLTAHGHRNPEEVFFPLIFPIVSW